MDAHRALLEDGARALASARAATYRPGPPGQGSNASSWVAVRIGTVAAPGRVPDLADALPSNKDSRGRPGSTAKTKHVPVYVQDNEPDEGEDETDVENRTASENSFGPDSGSIMGGGSGTDGGRGGDGGGWDEWSYWIDAGHVVIGAHWYPGSGQMETPWDDEPYEPIADADNVPNCSMNCFTCKCEAGPGETFCCPEVHADCCKKEPQKPEAELPDDCAFLATPASRFAFYMKTAEHRAALWVCCDMARRDPNPRGNDTLNDVEAYCTDQGLKYVSHSCDPGIMTGGSKHVIECAQTLYVADPSRFMPFVPKDVFGGGP